MTKIEITKMLEKHTYVQDEIRNCMEAVQRLSDLACNERDIKAAIISGMPGNPSRKSDPTFRKVQRIMDEYKKEVDRIEVRQNGLFEKKALVEDMMRALSPMERKVVELRHFKKYQWWMVSSQMGFHERHCRRIRKEAIQAIVDWSEEKK